MHQSSGCSGLCLPVLSEEVDDVQRRSIDQPDSQVKGCFPMFLKQKASGETPLRKWEDCGEDEEQGGDNQCTDVSVCQRDGLHQVHSLGVNLDEGEDVPGLHRVAQGVEPRGRVRTLLPSESLFCVLGGDEIFPRLPDKYLVCSAKLKAKKYK